MKPLLLFFLSVLAMPMAAQDEAYVTAGDGTVYNFEKLSTIRGSGVVNCGGTNYNITNDVTIAEGDSFAIESMVRVNLASDVRLTFKGGASLQAVMGVVAPMEEADGFAALPYGLVVNNSRSVTQVSGIIFYDCGLRNMGQCGLDVSNCSFIGHNGVSGSAALLMGPDGAAFTVRDCYFSRGQRAAIGGAANYRNPVLIEHCTFEHNGQENRNAPQLNLTVADSVVVRNCVVAGDSTLNMVGGITVSNLMSYSGDYHTLVEDCTISNHRFGLATYLLQDAVIRHNTIVNNRFETNPMNGGSGINVYDPYQQQTTRIEGNHIEGNLWGITVIGGREVNIGKTSVPTDAPDYNQGLNTFLNNGNGGQVYDLYNNSANTVYAQNNYWLTASAQTAEGIEQTIFHRHDQATLGEVVFAPWANATSAVNDISVRNTQADGYWLPDGRRAAAGQRHGLLIERKDGRCVKHFFR